MKLKQKLFFLFSMTLVLTCVITSCIKSEEPNAEADILSCSVKPDDILIREPEINNSDVLLIVKKGTDLSSITLDFTLTEGATIDPPNGTELDFNSPKTFKVTSEDGKWNKTYKVSITDADMSTTYHFEDTIMKNKNQPFYIIAEKDINKNITLEWASGNAGYSLTGVAKNADDYPTTISTNGYKGNCIKLTTKDTGFFGRDYDMPLAAGNIFIGSFHTNQAIKEPLKATLFGRPFDKYPTRLTGYYKYKRGNDFLVLDKESGKQTIDPNKKDICDIYAVFYETDENFKSLDGSNSLTHPNIVAVARIKDAKETNSWTFFDLEFDYNKKPNHDKVQAGEYNLAIVFTSSIEGHLFNGALGSTLYIDEVELKYTENLENYENN